MRSITSLVLSSYILWFNIVMFICYPYLSGVQASAEKLSQDVVVSEDKRTPFEKYQGAYLGAWLLCCITQKKIYLLEKAREKGIKLDKELDKDTDMAACIKNGLAEMKKEYNSMQTFVHNEEGKKALLDHYVAAIMHVKETYPLIKEGEEAYIERMNATKRRTDELLVRFEITQP